METAGPQSRTTAPLVYLPTEINSVTLYALLDSGSNISIMNSTTFQKLQIQKIQTSRIRLTFGNGDSYTSDESTAPVIVKLGHHTEELVFQIAEIPEQSIILGMDWLQTHNPIIDWPSLSLQFSSHHCREFCIPDGAKVTISGISNPRRNIVTVIRHHPSLVSTSTPESSHIQLPEQFQKFKNVFDKTLAEQNLPPHRDFDFKIELKNPNDIPPYQKPYKLSPAQDSALEEYIHDMLAKGHIRASKSPSGAPIFFQPKPGGGLRPCVDYTKLNNMTVKDRYPIPLVSDLLDQIKGAKLFTKIDLRAAYNLVRIREGDEWKTAFTSRYGHYEYTVMPFGLANAPAVFMRFIQTIFRDLLKKEY